MPSAKTLVTIPRVVVAKDSDPKTVSYRRSNPEILRSKSSGHHQRSTCSNAESQMRQLHCLKDGRPPSPSAAASGKPSGEGAYSQASCERDRDRAERITLDTIRCIINQIFGGITPSFGQSPCLNH